MTDLVTNNLLDFVPSTTGLLDRFTNMPHSSLNGSVKLLCAALGKLHRATLKLVHNGIGVNPIMLIKAMRQDRNKPLQIVGDGVRNTGLYGNDGGLLQSSTRRI
jgi:hypothetical protein